jgi:hypothetical protein
VSDKDWEKLMAKVDKEIAAIPESGPPPAKAGPRASAPAAKGATAAAPSFSTERTWPAYARLALATALAVGVYFWPYENRCGVGLYGYLAAVIVVAIGGVWSAVWTWRHQTARAHVLSIVLIVWGLVLAGAQVLPRTGYAKQVLPWSCSLPTKKT